MTRYWMAIAAALVVGACDDGKDTGGTTETHETGEEQYTTNATVEWGSSAVTVTVENPDGDYWFGIAEVGASCGDQCWTGEDCNWGYTTGDGTNYSYCHFVPGGSASYSYGGDPTALDDSSETVFTSDFASDVSYYLESDSTGDCWVGGVDPSYYDGLGCTDTSGSWTW